MKYLTTILIHLITSYRYAFICSEVDAFSLGMNVNNVNLNKKYKRNKNDRKKKQRKSNKSTVDAMALKIGLNVVPASHYSSNIKNNTTARLEHGNTNKTKKKKTKAPIIILWGRKAKEFFWKKDPNSLKKKFICETGRQLTMKQITNDQNFPLFQIENVLDHATLDRAQSLLADRNVMKYAEELEQHELVDGKVKALRRSFVSQLSYQNDDISRQILDLVMTNLPINLVEGTKQNESKDNDLESDHPHPYEDGSIVYYRATGNDFYDTHHDSYDPNEPPRTHQRAYTILLYLRVPLGSPTNGGTEFPRLTLSSSSNKAVVVKPIAGDALLWPNFNIEGNPCMQSVHRALPMQTANNKYHKHQDDSNDHDEMSKIVINLWFEGRMS